MRRSLRVHPAVDVEVDEAAAYPNERTPGAGNDFVVAVGVAMRNARRAPRTGSLVARTRSKTEVRRLRVRPNDYQIVYVVYDDYILVVAVAHNKRLPLYWRARLSD